MIKIYIILLILFLLCLYSNYKLYGGNLDDRNRKITTIKNLNNIIMNQKQFRIYDMRKSMSFYLFGYFRRRPTSILSNIISISDYKELLIMCKNSVIRTSNSTIHNIYSDFIEPKNSQDLFIQDSQKYINNKIFDFDNINNDIFQEEHKEYIIKNYSKLLNDLNEEYKRNVSIITNKIKSEKNKNLDDKSILEIIDDQIKYCNDYPNLDKDKIFTESKIINIIKWISGRDDIKIDKINNEYKVLINNSNKELKMSDFKFPKFKLNYTDGASICPNIFIDKYKIDKLYKYNKFISNLRPIILNILQIHLLKQLETYNISNIIQDLDYDKICNLKETFRTMLQDINNKNDIELFYYLDEKISTKSLTSYSKICEISTYFIKYYNLFITKFQKKLKNNLKTIITTLITEIDKLDSPGRCTPAASPPSARGGSSSVTNPEHGGGGSAMGGAGADNEKFINFILEIIFNGDKNIKIQNGKFRKSFTQYLTQSNFQAQNNTKTFKNLEYDNTHVECGISSIRGDSFSLTMYNTTDKSQPDGNDFRLLYYPSSKHKDLFITQIPQVMNQVTKNITANQYIIVENSEGKLNLFTDLNTKDSPIVVSTINVQGKTYYNFKLDQTKKKVFLHSDIFKDATSNTNTIIRPAFNDKDYFLLFWLENYDIHKCLINYSLEYGGRHRYNFIEADARSKTQKENGVNQYEDDFDIYADTSWYYFFKTTNSANIYYTAEIGGKYGDPNNLVTITFSEYLYKGEEEIKPEKDLEMSDLKLLI